MFPGHRVGPPTPGFPRLLGLALAIGLAVGSLQTAQLLQAFPVSAPRFLVWLVVCGPWALAAGLTIPLIQGFRRFLSAVSGWRWAARALGMLGAFILVYAAAAWPFHSLFFRWFPGVIAPGALVNPGLQVLIAFDLVDSALLTFSLAWTVFLAMESTSELQRKEEQTLLRGLEAALAEVRTIRMRLDPDFLVRGLQHLRRLIEGTPEPSEDFSYLLNAYLRQVLDGPWTGQVSLEAELSLARRYLELHQSVTGCPFDMQIRMPEADLERHQVPSLFIHPLVRIVARPMELEGRWPSRIGLRVEARGEGLAVELEESWDTGEPQPLDPGAASALEELRQSLALAHGPGVGLEVVEGPGPTRRYGLTFRRQEAEPDPPDLPDSAPGAVPPLLASPWIQPSRYGRLLPRIATAMLVCAALLSLWAAFETATLAPAGPGFPQLWLLKFLRYLPWVLTAPLLFLAVDAGLGARRTLLDVPLLGLLWLAAAGAHSWLAEALRAAARLLWTGLPAPGPGSPPITILFLYAILLAGFRAIALAGLAQDRQLAALRLEALGARAELRALRLRLDPHFLFNALNCLHGLLREDPATARQMVLRIERFLVRVLRSAQEDLSSLADEFDQIADYLEIHRIRFGPRFQVRMDHAPDLGALKVPTMILQPVVENAVKHGFKGATGDCAIEVTARIEDGTLVVRVWDNAGGAPPRAPAATGGVGLSTVRERLVRIYGSDAGLRCGPLATGGFEVQMRLPVASPL